MFSEMFPFGVNASDVDDLLLCSSHVKGTFRKMYKPSFPGMSSGVHVWKTSYRRKKHLGIALRLDLGR